MGGLSYIVDSAGTILVDENGDPLVEALPASAAPTRIAGGRLIAGQPPIATALPAGDTARVVDSLTGGTPRGQP